VISLDKSRPKSRQCPRSLVPSSRKRGLEKRLSKRPKPSCSATPLSVRRLLGGRRPWQQSRQARKRNTKQSPLIRLPPHQPNQKASSLHSPVVQNERHTQSQKNGKKGKKYKKPKRQYHTQTQPPKIPPRAPTLSPISSAPHPNLEAAAKSPT